MNQNSGRGDDGEFRRSGLGDAEGIARDECVGTARVPDDVREDEHGVGGVRNGDAVVKPLQGQRSRAAGVGGEGDVRVGRHGDGNRIQVNQRNGGRDTLAWTGEHGGVAIGIGGGRGDVGLEGEDAGEGDLKRGRAVGVGGHVGEAEVEFALAETGGMRDGVGEELDAKGGGRGAVEHAAHQRVGVQHDGGNLGEVLAQVCAAVEVQKVVHFSEAILAKLNSSWWHGVGRGRVRVGID